MSIMPPFTSGLLKKSDDKDNLIHKASYLLQHCLLVYAGELEGMHSMLSIAVNVGRASGGP